MATEEEKAAAAKQREQIDVINNKKEEPEKVEAKEEEVVEEEKEEVEEKEEAIEESEEREDELKEQIANAKDDRQKERFEKRLAKEVGRRKELEKELATTKAALAAKPDDEKVYTEEEVERRAEQKAVQKQIETEFNASVARIATSCEKLDKAFSTKVNAMVEEVSGPNTYLPAIMVGVLDDLPNNGGAVLLHLAANPDEYEEIYQLSPARMALKLKDISDAIVAKEKKAKAKEISKVPEPKDKVAGKGTTPEQRASEKDDMDTFVRKRAREVEERQKARMH